MKKLSLILVCCLMTFAVACSKSPHHPCDGVTCSDHGTCDDSSGRAVCECDEGYAPNGQLGCDEIVDPCKDVECDEWEYCDNGSCHIQHGRCDENSDCQSNKCNMETHRCEYTGLCEGVTCNYHGECMEGAGYGSGYGSGYSSGNSYQSGGIYCNCENGYRPENVGETPTCVNENCLRECGDKSFCEFDENGNEYCECIDGYNKDDDDNCVIIDPCDLDCGVGHCIQEDGAETCDCPEGYFFNEEEKTCLQDKCINDTCKEWETCERKSGSCTVVYPNCNSIFDNDCEDGETCDNSAHKCVEDLCKSKNINCGNGGVCTVENGNTVCNCPDSYYDNNNSCVKMDKSEGMWYGVQHPPYIPYEDPNNPTSDPYMVYGQIYINGQTGNSVAEHTNWRGYKEGTGKAEYPIIAGTWTWKKATFSPAEYQPNNHQYQAQFPQDKAGDFIYIFRFSLDDGKSWWYGDAGDGGSNGPHPVESENNYPGKATIEGGSDELFTLDYSSNNDRTADSYTFKLKYHGTAAIDFAASVITLNGVETDDYEYDAATKTFTVSQTGLEPNKYSWLFRLVDDNGEAIEPFFVPIWIGEGVDFADFGWRDAFVYQIMTDRFLNGDPGNDVPSSEFPHVTQDLEKWKGGDFRGIIKKIDDGYFTKMGVNAIWISSPVKNPHYESKGGTASSQDNVYFTSYHAYHPLATGYSFDNDYGFDNEGVDTAFGTADELRELVEKAHKKGIRVIPDFAANHVYIDAPLYQQHKNDGWFYNYNPCDGHWDDHRIDCWFTPYMPDFNYNNAEARKAVIAHAIWLIENFNLDGFRADALKHMDDIFTIELRSAIKEKIETTVKDHDLPDEAEVFYMVGESLGGWARYHTRASMVQGQVNEDFYYKAKDIILKGNSYNSLAHDVTEAWDKAYLTPQSTNGGTGGFPGAVMGNFFGNHDQNRALTECGKNYTLLKHAQTFLLTSPINIPMLYQGDDIGMEGVNENGFDGGRRAVMKFTSLSPNEQDALQHIQKLGTFRKSHPALRHGSRSTCGSTDDAWVYKLKYNDKTVIVGINKGSSEYTTTCNGENSSFTSYDGSSVSVSNGSVKVPAKGSLVIGN